MVSTELKWENVQKVFMTLQVLVLPGEGIGPEVIKEAVKVLRWFISYREIDVAIRCEPYGVESYKSHGVLISDTVFQSLLSVDAVLFGATGGPEFDSLPTTVRQSRNLLAIRKHMGVYANLRPVRAYDELADVTSLKESAVENTDIVVVRELNGGIYFGEPRGRDVVEGGIERASNTLTYTVPEIERIARVAFNLAHTRNGHVHSVDKSNVLETYKLWREVVTRIGKTEFPDIPLEHIIVDNCAMQIIRNPRQFDVILADNMIGDILSDLAGAITGTLGMLPSVSLSDTNEDGHRCALFEPVHGSAPDIAGQGVANPLAAIMCVGLLFEYSLKLPQEAVFLSDAVSEVLASGCRTEDIKIKNRNAVSTEEMGDEILKVLCSLNKT